MSREPQRWTQKWRPWAYYIVSELGDLFGILIGLVLALVILAFVVSFAWALVQDLRTDEPLDCSTWSPGKVAENPHDMACEGQWEDQLNELNL
jgi:uncharacterized membrane protein